MRISITREAYGTLLGWARQNLPLEACGLVAGRLADGGKEITRAVPLANAQASRERFGIDPREQLAAVKALRSEGLAPLGNFHSHPETPARPSGEDLKLFRDPAASYLILSLAGPEPVLKAFGLTPSAGEGAFAEEELEII
ncbi:MAG: M67 family metallopeptidase [Deltaproteobacteria bacterium]|jgi:proteasome lid subunit RPN8/RPN11|nr:M67 family metallopeptidase [Deltaproteobacteria bacterium]